MSRRVLGAGYHSKATLFAVCSMLLFGINSQVGLKAQDLPEQLHFNKDTSRLIYGGIPSNGFYDESAIKSVYLEFYTDNYWDQMIDMYNTDGYVLARLINEDITYDSIAVQFKGQTSFKRPEKGGSKKLSFSVKLDEIIDGQDIEGYNNFNFNNAFQDFSFMREVLYGNLSRRVFPALKGNFIRLYLNGEDWGLYTNIQQLNGDFIKEWFFDKDGIRWRADVPAEIVTTKGTGERPGGGGANWGDGTAALNFLGDSTALYQKYYTLKDTDMLNPWDYLIQVCDVLNNTPLVSVYDSLNKILDIDATLWFLAREIAFSDDDSYVHKGKMDYYLYVNEKTGKMTPLEFDGNSAMSVQNNGWSPFMNEEDENYPLLHILLSVPELRQRYIAHMKTLLDLALDPEMVKNQIDEYEVLIGPELMTDPKIDFAITEHSMGLNQLKSFFDFRSSFILSNAEFQHEAPEISEVRQWQDDREIHFPMAHEGVSITAIATHPDGLHELNLYYSAMLTGDFKLVKMNDDGNDGDVTAMDGIFSAKIPELAGGSFVRYYVEAVAGDSVHTVSYMPGKAEYEVFVYAVAHPVAQDSRIVINELMASNNTTMADEAGEFDDWIELHNMSIDPVSFSGYHLSDNSANLFKWMFPDTTITEQGYLVVWADDDVEQGSMHTNFKLSASGEELILTDKDSAIVDKIVFSTQVVNRSFGRWPNGTGSFVEMPASFHEENRQSETSIQKDFSTSEFSVYPNPTDDIIYITCAIAERKEIQLYSIMGKLVYSDKFTEKIDLGHLTPGLYILRCGENSRKLMVQ